MSYQYQSGYSAEFIREREAEQARQEAERKQWERENREARERYLAQLEAEKQAIAERHAAEEERQLAPAKAQERRRWLIDHPDRTDADFERVWPLIREEKYTGRQARIAREIEAQRRKYGMPPRR